MSDPVDRPVSDLGVRVIRVDGTDRRTIGIVLVDHVYLCYSLEDAIRPVKIPGQSAIPAGRYRLAITHSARFGRKLPILVDVPGYAGIRIHPGNTHEDTAGCILVGLHRNQDTIFESVSACALLQKMLADQLAAGGAAWIAIDDCF